MTEEQLQTRKILAGEKNPSMLRRSDTHDYTGKCFYLVTMTVEGRQPLLGVLTGRVEARLGAADAPAVDLSPLGRAVSEAWEAISSHYPQVAVIAQQVMPDHFHGILFFRENTDGLHLGHVIRGFKAATNRAYRRVLRHCRSQPSKDERAQACCGARATTIASFIIIISWTAGRPTSVITLGAFW